MNYFEINLMFTVYYEETIYTLTLFRRTKYLILATIKKILKYITEIYFEIILLIKVIVWLHKN